MNTVKKLLSLLLALCLCLSLCACTKAPAQDEEEEDLAGADWRTWGLIADYGTITQDGASMDLALTIEADQAVLYLDQSDMVTFAELRYPVAIDNAADCYSSIEFVDLDEDGYDDIRLLFDSETDGAILLTYFWDGEDYVFDYDYSKLPGQSEDDEAEVTPEPAVESDAMYAVQLDQPFFEAAGLSVNALPDDGTYYLQNGAASFTDGYTRYYRSDAQWEVRKDSETDLGDGTRQIEFTAICYIPDADIPNFSGEYYPSCSMEMFDYYTGLWLADAQVYGDTTHGDNTYYYSIEYNGTPYDVLYSYSTDWMQQVGDYSAILMVNYQVVIPNGYDGLIFAGVPTAVDGEARDERGYAVDHYALQNILEAPDFEPYNALFFNIN